MLSLCFAGPDYMKNNLIIAFISGFAFTVDLGNILVFEYFLPTRSGLTDDVR